jgi:hypothetical protein
MSFEHICDFLPLLPDFVFVDHAHVSYVLLSIVVFDEVDFFLIFILLLVALRLAAFNCEAGNFELSPLPFGERSGCSTSPEHPTDPLELVVLFASQMLIARELLDVKESLVPQRILNNVGQRLDESNCTLSVVFPRQETGANPALEVIAIIHRDQFL